MIAAVSSELGASTPGLVGEVGGDALGRDAFLRLLITQLQMQDPLEPLKADDFVAQLAQFSSVEQLESANLQLALLQLSQGVSQSLALIGRRIATDGGGEGGLVEAVVFVDGQPKLVVGDQQVDPGDVIRVW